MTQDQKTYITQSRLLGASYNSIAKAINLPEATIKTFCKRSGILPQNEDTTKVSICKNCGKPITSTPGKKQRQFCSRDCGLQWWHKHPEKLNKKAVYSFICLHCGKEFSSYGAKNRKFCSVACSTAHRTKELLHDFE